jgi:2-oxoglutarate ferredoxin oxidoreductase subunit alpha
MNLTIGFSGPAGAGVNTAGVLLAELLAKKGYSLWCDKEYASVIKGDNNCFFISLSDVKQIQLSKKIDLFFAFDQFAIDKNQEIYTLGHSILLKGVASKCLNIFALGVCLQIIHLSFSEGEAMIERSFSADQWEENFAALKAGMMYGKQHFPSLCESINLSEKIGESRTLMMGNQLIGEGAIKAGLEFYSAYPMTPVTSLIDTIVQHPEVTFFQGEDEIAVAMAMLGARFAGKRAMCGTS